MKQRNIILLLLLLLLGGAFFYAQKQVQKQAPETEDTPQTAVSAVTQVQPKAAAADASVPMSTQMEIAKNTGSTDALEDNPENLPAPLDEDLLDPASLFHLKANHLQAVQNVRETKEVLSPSAPR